MNELIGSEVFKAQRADEEIQRGLRKLGIDWVEVSLMVLNFQKHEWYRALGFEHFNAWMEVRLGESRASLYKKMRIVKQLSESLPVSTLQTIPIANCENLLEVPPSKRMEMAESARSLPAAEFAALVEKVPGNGLQGRESSIPVTFVLSVSQKRIVDAALSKMMEQEDGPKRRADALEFICQAWKDCPKCQEDIKDGN